MHIYTVPQSLPKHTKYLQFKNILRNFFVSKGSIEIEVPTLSPQIIPESHLGIFTTTYNNRVTETPLYLTPHPELFIKRLVAQTQKSIFTIARSYRNYEQLSSEHSPEFEMLEYYMIDSDYTEMMERTQELLAYLALSLHNSTQFTYQEKLVDCSQLRKITVEDAFQKYANIKNSNNELSFIKQAKHLGYTVENYSYTDIWSQVYTDKIEPNLGCDGIPTVIYEYPLALGGVSRYDKKRGIAERFELYIHGIELANAANEGTYYTREELENHFYSENSLRSINGVNKITPDEGFIDVMLTLQKCTGIGIGIERLAQIFLNTASIQELKPFVIQ